jgi:hypothetical protein
MKNYSKLSTEEIAQNVDEDGLEFALKSYDGADFEDEQLGALWNQTCDLLYEIQDMLDEATEGDDDAA